MIDLVINSWEGFMSYIFTFMIGMFFMLWLVGGCDDD